MIYSTAQYFEIIFLDIISTPRISSYGTIFARSVTTLRQCSSLSSLGKDPSASNWTLYLTPVSHCSRYDTSAYCLAVLLTHRDFPLGIQGLAWRNTVCDDRYEERLFRSDKSSGNTNVCLCVRSFGSNLSRAVNLHAIFMQSSCSQLEVSWHS